MRCKLTRYKMASIDTKGVDFRMKHIYLFIFMFFVLNTNFSLQTYSQSIAIKSNVLYDITGTINLGGEIKCFDDQSFSLSLNYNPWEFGSNKKMKQFQIQPEYRKWFDQVFIGSFIGVEAHYARYNFGSMTPFTTIRNNRYQGTLVGLGATYGYQWIINPYWNLEASISLGYSYLDYKKYGPEKGDALFKKSHSNYWGPTQLGLTFIYFIR